MEYKVGQDVWIHLPWVDDECWVAGTFIKATAKRIKCKRDRCSGDTIEDGYYKPENVKPRN